MSTGYPGLGRWRREMQKIFLAQVDGFSEHFGNLDDLRNWVHAMDRRFGLKGKTLNIYQGTRSGDTASYDKSRSMVVQ